MKQRKLLWKWNSIWKNIYKFLIAFTYKMLHCFVSNGTFTDVSDFVIKFDLAFYFFVFFNISLLQSRIDLTVAY